MEKKEQRDNYQKIHKSKFKQPNHKIKTFLSIDIIDSTKAKIFQTRLNINYQKYFWFGSLEVLYLDSKTKNGILKDIIEAQYSDFDVCSKVCGVSGFKPFKYLGDQVLFKKEGKAKPDQLYQLCKIVHEINTPKINNLQPSIYNYYKKRHNKSKIRKIEVKAGIWQAEDNFGLPHNQIYENDNNINYDGYIKVNFKNSTDYIGPGMDYGFRLLDFAKRDNMVVDPSIINNIVSEKKFKIEHIETKSFNEKENISYEIDLDDQKGGDSRKLYFVYTGSSSFKGFDNLVPIYNIVTDDDYDNYTPLTNNFNEVISASHKKENHGGKFPNQIEINKVHKNLLSKQFVSRNTSKRKKIIVPSKS